MLFSETQHCHHKEINVAVPNTNWSEITTTTLFNRSKKLADNV